MRMSAHTAARTARMPLRGVSVKGPLVQCALLALLLCQALALARAQPGAPADGEAAESQPSALLNALETLRSTDASAGSGPKPAPSQGSVGSKDATKAGAGKPSPSPKDASSGGMQDMQAALPALYAQDCSQVDGGVSQIELADKSDVVITGKQARAWAGACCWHP